MVALPYRPPALQSDPPFSLANGRYSVQAEIGRGAHAVIFRARDEQYGRDVAVKVLRADVTEPGLRERFVREVRVMAQLQHRHIAPVYDSGEWNGRPYLITELASGASLAAHLERRSPLPVDEAIAIATDVADALHYAHQKGVIHRDVKPDNILLTPGGAVLSDFGIARVLGLAMDEASVTSTGVAVGTLQYMSPEQLCAEKDIDGRSDEYALALVLYEMLAGVRPHVSASAEGFRMLRLSGRQHALRDHRPMVPAGVNAAVMRALAAAPADRFATCGDFAQALRDGATSAPGGAANQVEGFSFRRGRVRMAGIVAGIAALVVAVGYGLNHFAPTGRQANAERDSLDDSVRLAMFASNGTNAKEISIDSRVRTELALWRGIAGIDVPGMTSATDWKTLSRAGASVGVDVSTQTVSRDSSVVTVRVRSAAGDRTLEPVRYATAAGLSDGAIRRIVIGIIGGRAASVDSAPGIETLVEPKREALSAYVRAWRLLRAGEMDSAASRFRSAAAGSAPFAGAQFWAAQVVEWTNSSKPELWKADAARAAQIGGLRPVDSLSAVALAALGAEDYPRACAAYRAAIALDATSFVAWYGLGECQRLDRVAVADAKSPTGLRFRSSTNEALRAYLAALDRVPSPSLGDLFTGPSKLTFATMSIPRFGRLGAPSGERLAALPTLAGDTVTFWPIPIAEFANSSPRGMPDTYAEAVRHGRTSLLRFSEQWVRLASTSYAAHLGRALALELNGSYGDADGGALFALRGASRLAHTSEDSISLWVASARIRLRAGDFAGAARAADSALRDGSVRSASDAQRIAPSAALLGRREALASLQSRASQSASQGLPVWLAERYGRMVADAALNECAGLSAFATTLDSGVATHFSPNEQTSARAAWIVPASRLAVPCLGRAAAAKLVPEVPFDRAVQAWSRGDSRLARAILDSMVARRRGANAATIAWDQEYAESWLLVQTGDTLEALRRLEAALRDLGGMNEFVLDYVPQAAGLRNGLRLAATLSAARGNVAGRDRWNGLLHALGDDAKH